MVAYKSFQKKATRIQTKTKIHIQFSIAFAVIPLNQCMVKNINSNSKYSGCNCCETNSENNGKCNCCDLTSTPTVIISNASAKDCPLDLSCCNRSDCIRVCLRETQDCCGLSNCQPVSRSKSTSTSTSSLLAKAAIDICKCPPDKCSQGSCCSDCAGQLLNIC